MPCRFVLVALSTLLALTACSTPTPQWARGVTFVIVRHAEKSSDDPRDPSLSVAGQARAAALAARFSGQPLAAAYATPFKRTQQTVQPSATASGIDVMTYDAALPAADLARRLRSTHAHGTILVAGHSNTVPDIVAALCNCAVAAMGDADYGQWFEVRIDRASRATLTERSY